MLPVLENVREGLPELGFALLKAAAFLAAMLFLGSRVLPLILARLAAWGSRELFLVCVVAIGLGIGYATYLVGLSFAFGAFVAGMVLSESDYSHQALAEIEPLRDVFAMIFFVSVGLLIDPAFLWKSAGTIALVVVLVLLVKGLIFGGLARAFGYVNIAPFAVGLGLFQVGEFSFLLAREGISTDAISQGTYSLVLATAAITMALTPLIARLAPALYGRYRRRFPREPRTFNVPRAAAGHAIIDGRAGGSFVARCSTGSKALRVIEATPLAPRASRRAFRRLRRRPAQPSSRTPAARRAGRRKLPDAIAASSPSADEGAAPDARSGGGRARQQRQRRLGVY